MRTTRIEIEGAAGHVAIERKSGQCNVRIDSVIRDPKRNEQAWKVWEIAITANEGELFGIADEAFTRTEGHTGTNSDVHDLLREIQRFI